MNYSSSACVATQDVQHVCPVCNDSSHLIILCKVDAFDIFTCKNCAAVHVLPVPSPRELKAYYDRHEWFEANEKGGYQNYDAQTGWSVELLKELFDEYDCPQGASILDVGCGYGTHLAAAAERGLKCFGVELSDHARKIAQNRLGDKAYVVGSVAELIPHEFDLVLLMDVIEHLASPYELFYELFSIGAITPKTRVIVTTPNAGSVKAQNDPAGWPYLHPPSHLVYYTAETLSYLLSRLRFKDVSIRGLHPSTVDEVPDSLAAFDGLLVTAAGSDFTEFMRERYVPGTWSKIAEYEHLPRYALTRSFAAGKDVLDFGCGTGYGSAILAEVAASVTALDIDESALSWARDSHHNPRLNFIHSSDLGAGLPTAAFDLISCFEMIEHVEHATQQAVIASFGRLLRDDGLLIISTPNPEVTKQYGENPYHLREMSEAEFLELLHSEFPNVRIFSQRVLNSILFDANNSEGDVSLPAESGYCASGITPLAFVALCSRRPLVESADMVFFDAETDPIRNYIDQEERLNRARFAVYETTEQKAALAAELATKETELAAKETELAAKETELAAIKQTRVFRLHDVLVNQPWSPRKVSELAKLLGGGMLPRRLRGMAKSAVPKMKSLVRKGRSTPSGENPLQYTVCQRHPSMPQRVKVVHIIANFMVGGSSRLVVDLLEYLGHEYDQSVVTSFIPTPPVYSGLDIHEICYPENERPFLEILRRLQPAFIHLHYWGDTDEPWYSKAMRAAEILKVPVVENVNTPIAPYRSSAVCRYVYVSNYVRRVFGKEEPEHMTIYPGSDFSRFSCPPDKALATDCVGMVYRLECDKLNDQAILPFLRTVQKRPQTRVLIVGGGSLLDPFREAVNAAGLSDSFEFTGYVRYDELPSLYGRMSVFVAPVWKESFGQVSPFAMNMEVPVVGYDVGAIGEIVDDSMLLAPPADAEKLADIIVRLLESDELRQTIGKRQRERAQSLFSLESMIDRYTELYADVCKSTVAK